MPTRRWEIPEGLRVLPDGSWRVGELQVLHPPTLRYLKAHLVDEAGTPWLVDGERRMPIQLDGPPFEVLTLVLSEATGSAAVVLDDGSKEQVTETSLGMNQDTGRFECIVRDGRFRARLSRAAHALLLDHVVEEGGVFLVRVGAGRIPLRT
jgi:hypothetical protein